MLPKRLPLPATTLLKPQLYLTHPRSSRLSPIASSAVVAGSTTRRAAASTSSPAGEHHEEHHGGGHESHYDPPGGWLWGIRPGEKYEKEGWEGLFIYGFFGSFIVAGIAYAYKPDTSIQTWALEEARRRLEKEGFLEDPNPDWKPSSGK